jgi:hypothetical protein
MITSYRIVVVTYAFQKPQVGEIMKLHQWYETSVADEEGHELTFITVPARSFADTNLPKNPLKVLESLGFDTLLEVGDTEDLKAMLLASLLGDTADDISSFGWKDDIAVRSFSDFEAKEAEKFIQEVAAAKVVPFEQSPLDLQSLTALTSLAKASTVGLGAWVGVVAAGPTPLVIITVPVGILLVGASAIVAKALGDGLAYKLRKVMGLPEELPEPPRRRRSRTQSGSGGGQQRQSGAG